MANEDTTLMLRTKQGDQAAFKKLVEKHKLSVLNLCLRFTGHKEDAEDLAQDVFIRVYKAASRYEVRALFTTWLYRIAVNLCLNYQRRKKILTFFSIDNNDSSENEHQVKVPELTTFEQPDTDLEKKERQQIVQQAIQSLPENQRTVVILYRYNILANRLI